jgi:hypothetical protein
LRLNSRSSAYIKEKRRGVRKEVVADGRKEGVADGSGKMEQSSPRKKNTND